MRTSFVLLTAALLVGTLACGSSESKGTTGTATTGSGGETSGGSGGDSASTTGTGGGSAERLHVVDNHLVDKNGKVVQLHGVNRSGTEYACVQDFGIFDGPSDDASVAAIASWNANVVRVPLNEDC